jgi:hypothetical protein
MCYRHLPETRGKEPRTSLSNYGKLTKRLNANANAKPNLKTHSVTQQHPCTKKEEDYPIPNLINGQISSKDSRMNIKQTSSQHKE